LSRGWPLSALLAIPLLGEWPNETDWDGIILISAGVYAGKRSTIADWNQPAPDRTVKPGVTMVAVRCG
jgi:hypothetical protein